MGRVPARAERLQPVDERAFSMRGVSEKQTRRVIRTDPQSADDAARIVAPPNRA